MINTLFTGAGCPVQSLSRNALFAESLYIFSQLQGAVLMPMTISNKRGSQDIKDIETLFHFLDVLNTEIRRRFDDEILGLKEPENTEPEKGADS